MNMKIYIYGTGLIAKRIVYHLDNSIIIKGYIQSHLTMDKFLESIVYKPSILQKDSDYDYVVIASSYVSEIMQILRKKMFQKKKLFVIGLRKKRLQESMID